MAERDLFGGSPARTDPHEVVRLRLNEHPSHHTDKAFALSGPASRDPLRFAPRSQVTRHVGRDGVHWAMPRWLAADRGWV